ncbi:MAG: 6-bladed beta-propeller [Spirochaetes bacterium]|nr:6-bladed beta-propeller [Spirochaetota bacterium]
MITRVLIIGSIVFGISGFNPSYSQDIKLDQKKGIIQDDQELHLRFSNINRIDLEEHGVFFHKVQKALMFINKIFVLDQQLSSIFVIDETGEFLYSIGRAGQGPGEIEYPAEFTISESGTIYVVNHRAKRLEVFSLGGDFIRRIELKIPEEIFYSQPWQILAGPQESLYVSYILSSHLIDVYNENGEFLRNVVMRNDPINIPGKNIGNCSQIAFIDENKILHFDRFTGVFTIISEEGKIENKFSAYDENNQKYVKRIQNEFKNADNKTPYTSSSIFLNWSNFWIDADERIYTLLLLKDEKKGQQIFCFSKNGEFLYKSPIPTAVDNIINKAYFCDNKYLFVTTSDEFFLAKKGD